MRNKNLKQLFAVILIAVMTLTILPAVLPVAYAASGSLTMSAEGLTASFSGDGTWSGGGTAVSGSVTGKDSILGSWANSDQSATLTLKNTRDKTAILSFDYNITKNTGSVTIGGFTKTGSGHYETNVAANATIKVVIKSGKGASNTTAIELTNISLVVDTSATTTFKTPENGAYTVNGEAITGDTAKTQKSTEAYALVATPAAGYNFIGWYNETAERYISYSATASIMMEADADVHPVFMDESLLVFLANANTYTDLNEANEAAQSASDKQITMIQSGVLAAGTYTISSGVKLLIPYGVQDQDLGTFSGTPKVSTEYFTPSMYSCLTMAEGAVIDCFGAINVNAVQYATSTNRTGEVTGPYGAIQMDRDSQINMKSGSTLYAYGYIGGNGLVWAESESSVYQLFQIEDWRGGNNSRALLSDLKNNSFLFSQYYIQNIEAALRLDSGCTMYGVAAIEADGTAYQSAPVIVGFNAGMFNLTSGYMTMTYLENTDRMQLDIFGVVATGGIRLSVTVLYIIRLDLDTTEYILSLPMNYTINVKANSSVSVAQRLKLLPGMEINIDEGAKVNVTSDGALYLYDKDDWNSGTYTYKKNLYQVRYIHAHKGTPVSRTVNADAVLNVDGTLTATGPVYSTKQVANGGNAGLTGNGTYTGGSHGSTNLKEVTGSTTDTATITCVPVTGLVAGHEGHQSLAANTTYYGVNDVWYQYALSVNENVTLISGGTRVEDTIYSGITKDDQTMSLVVSTGKPCLSISGIQYSKDGEKYTITAISDEAQFLAADHTEEADAAVPPTCTDTGLTEGRHCSLCGEVLVKQEIIKATGHTEEVNAAVPPTCEDTGLTEGKYCSVCEEILVDQEPVAALGHDYSVTIEGTYKAPTCTGDGKNADMRCSRCEAVETGTLIASLGHTEVVDKAVPPGCEDTGLTEGKHCSVCDEVLIEQETVDVLGHDYSVTIDGTYKASTCTEDGKQADKKCSRCEAVEPGSLIPAVGHSYGAAVTEPTCTEKGYTTHICSRCNHSYTDAEVPELDHNYSITVDGTYKAPTCTAEGKSEDKKCSRCDDVKQGSVIAVTGHSYSAVVTAPTCTEKGYTTHTCSRCNHSYTDAEVPELDHNYSVTVDGTYKAPTCTVEGKSEDKKCSRCDDVKQGSVIAVTGHSYGAVVTAPTCTEKGYTTHTCSACGDVKTDAYVDALGHTEEVDKAVPPSCEDTGLTEGRHCSVCGEVLVKQEIVKAAGHTEEVDAAVPPSCKDTGLTEGKHCSVCQEVLVKQETVNATGHTEKVDPAEAPTCTGTGLTEGKHCSVCDEVLVAQEAVDALGHDHSVVVEGTYESPTRGEAGKEADMKCSRCDDVKTGDTIPALGYGVTVSGTVTSFGADMGVVTVRLLQGEREVAVVEANAEGTYSVAEVSAGVYTLEFSKSNHVTRTYEITVTDDAVTQDAKIHLKGDINGDGKILANDNTLMMRHIRKTSLLEGYAFKCADINGDGKILANDNTLMMRHIRKTVLLW